MGRRAEPDVDYGSNIPLTEPTIVPCLFVTGAAIDTAYGVIRIVGWSHCPVIGGDSEERRIVVRIALTESAARTIVRQLQQVLYGGEALMG